MSIVFDPNKNSVNILKHGLSLSEAENLEWDNALVWQDQRRDYAETRMIGLAPFEERLYYVVYTDREEQRRIISLRKANIREVKFYADNN